MKNTLLALGFAAAATTANAAPVQFNTGPGANGSWYEIGLVALDWVTANAVANGLSHMGLAGHLATVTSAEEEAFIANLMLAAAGSIVGQSNQFIAWIGLNDIAVEGTHVWSGGPEVGTSPGYTNWLAGEPNNSGDEDAVHMTVSYAYGWNDLPTFFPLAYVVEYSDPDWTPPNVIPLPASMTLLLGGIGGLGLMSRRRRRPHATRDI